MAHPLSRAEAGQQQQGRQEGGRHVAHRFPALIAAPPAGQGRLWLTGARLFDGTGAPSARERGGPGRGRDHPPGRRRHRAVPRRRPPAGPGPAGPDAGPDRCPHPRLGVRPAHRQGRRGSAPRRCRALHAGRTARLPALRGDHHPRDRLPGTAAAAGPAGHALRRVPRPPPADLRQDHLGHRAGRALLRRHVPRGRRPGRRAAGGPGADPVGRGLRQGDDHRRPLQRAGGSRSAPVHRPGTGRRHRRGAPAGLPRLRPRRGPGRLRGGDQGTASTPSSTACT